MIHLLIAFKTRQAPLDLVSMSDDTENSRTFKNKDSINFDFFNSYYSSYWSKKELFESLSSYGFQLLGESNYHDSIPNPQNIYHALFILSEKKIQKNNNLSLLGFKNHPIILPPSQPLPSQPFPEYSIKKKNLINFFKNTNKINELLKIIRKNFNLSFDQITQIIKLSTKDLELIQNILKN